MMLFFDLPQSERMRALFFVIKFKQILKMSYSMNTEVQNKLKVLKGKS